MSAPIELPASVLKTLRQALKKFPEGQNQAAIKSVLMSAQDHYGWLSRPVMDAVAQALGVAKIHVYEVATFYTLFHTKEVGKHTLALCTNVSCWLRGGEELLSHARKKLGLANGEETTADGRFTIKEVECLAACAQAPAAQLDGHYCGPLTEESLDKLLKNPEKF